MTSEIDGLLLVWARWAVLMADSGLGFSKTTVLGRVIEYGPAGAAIKSQRGPHLLPSNDTAEHIDALVAQLPPHLKAVLKAEYLGRLSRKQSPKRLHLSYDAFNYRLTAAKRLLAAELV